ncbi:MAG: tetratricopeptide repeat protein [Planctomycetota bacterium]
MSTPPTAIHGVVIALLTFFGLALPGWAQTQVDLEELAVNAAESYRAGVERADEDPDESQRLFRRSIALHEQMLDRAGFENGYIYYNIANAYQRLGERGRAIVAYRRAERTLGEWPSLQANLAFARAGVGGPPPADRPWIARTLRGHERVSTPVRLWAALVIAGAGWCVLAVRVAGVARPAWGIGVAMLLLSTVPAGSLAVQVVTAPPPGAVVVADEVLARLGPSESGYEPAFNAPLVEGVELRVLERRGAWLLVQLDAGGSGWVPVSAVELVEPPTETDTLAR